MGVDTTVEVEALLVTGDQVEVRTRFDGRWARGFEIAGVTADGFRVRRRSDGRELPGTFGAGDIRRRRPRPSPWWELGDVRRV